MKINNGTKIVFLGDSLVNGACDETILGWTGRLCKEAIINGKIITYYNLGIRGETSKEILFRWKLEVTRRLSKNEDCRLVLSLGINDVSLVDGKQKLSTSESVANSSSILREARKDYEVVMVGPPPVLDEATSLRVSNLSVKLSESCRDIGVRYLDIYTPLVERNIYLEDLAKGDGYHPSSSGYSEISKVITATGLWWD